MKASQVEENLNDNGVYPDSVHKYQGEFIAKFGFYYKHGQTSDGKAEKIQEALPDAQIIDHQEHWNPWPKDSYFSVSFIL